MTDDKTDFELEVVQRLTRMETKIDIQNGVVKKTCDKVEALEKRADAGDVQWGTIKKMFVGLGGLIGVIGTVAGILAWIMR